MMRINTRCSIALHLLVLIAVSDGIRITSEIMADSTGCNPAMVRSLLGDLKKAGLIETQRGVAGAVLTADPKEITFWTVYQAVEKPTLDELIGFHPKPSEDCPVGSHIHALLEKPYRGVAESVRASLESSTLQELIDHYRMSFDPKKKSGIEP